MLNYGWDGPSTAFGYESYNDAQKKQDNYADYNAMPGGDTDHLETFPDMHGDQTLYNVLNYDAQNSDKYHSKEEQNYNAMPEGDDTHSEKYQDMHGDRTYDLWKDLTTEDLGYEYFDDVQNDDRYGPQDYEGYQDYSNAFYKGDDKPLLKYEDMNMNLVLGGGHGYRPEDAHGYPDTGSGDNEGHISDGDMNINMSPNYEVYTSGKLLNGIYGFFHLNDNMSNIC